LDCCFRYFRSFSHHKHRDHQVSTTGSDSGAAARTAAAGAACGATEIAKVHNDPAQPTPSWVRGLMLTHLDQDFASVFLRTFGAGTDSPFIAAEVRHVAGATRQDAAEGTAVGGRGAAFTLGVVGANPALFEKMPAAFARLTEDVAPWTAAETNINFMVRPASAAHYATAWPADTFARLAEVRRRYDPDGVFNPNAGY
jgi:hypothetical protein